jgi:hypothetical protein
MDSQQRQARARLGGLTAAANGSTNVAPARAAFEARFEASVRAEAAANGQTLSEAEIARRGQARRKLFFARLSWQSAKARRARSRKAPEGHGNDRPAA